MQLGNEHFLFSAEVFSVLLIVTPLGNSQDKNEKPREARPFTGVNLSLFRDYVCRTGSFFALADSVFNRLSFAQTGVPGRLDFRVVNEQVRAAVIGDYESETL